jgi:hypothetical protein
MACVACKHLCCLGSDVCLALSRDKSLLPSVETLQTTFEAAGCTRGRAGYIYFVFLCSASLWDERLGVCAMWLKSLSPEIHTQKVIIKNK